MRMLENKQSGFLKWIIILVVAIILASYFFDFNVQEAVEDERTQSNFHYIWTQIVEFYENILLPWSMRLKEWIETFIERISPTF